jgi:hypothetical protein
VPKVEGGGAVKRTLVYCSTRYLRTASEFRRAMPPPQPNDKALAPALRLPPYRCAIII